MRIFVHFVLFLCFAMPAAATEYRPPRWGFAQNAGQEEDPGVLFSHPLHRFYRDAVELAPGLRVSFSGSDPATTPSGADPGVTRWLSPISLWETLRLMKHEQLIVREPPARWIALALRRSPVREAPLSFAIASRSRSIPLPHKDPADRFIAATAAEMKLSLLTAHEKLLRCPDIDCLAP